jgi:hypothetical protein
MLPVQEVEAGEDGRGRWAHRLDGENLISKVVEESSGYVSLGTAANVAEWLFVLHVVGKCFILRKLTVLY